MDQNTDKNRKVSLFAGLAASVSFLILVIMVIALSGSPDSSTSGDAGESLGERDLSSLASVLETSGRVAGAQTAPTTSQSERDLRNQFASRIAAARSDIGQTAAHRDSTLDNSAQTEARRAAMLCRSQPDSTWRVQLENNLISEGRIIELQQSLITTSTGAANILDVDLASYSQLTSEYDAYGIGVAESAACDYQWTVVFHLASIR